MSNKVSPSELSKALNDFLMNYVEDIQEDVVECVDKVTKEARDELKDVSRAKFGSSGRPNPYWSGWSVKLQKRGKLKYHKVVWNKTNYQLTHLLEFGHHTRNGDGWVEARPHIRDVEQKYNVEFVDMLEEKIRRTK